MSHEPIRSWVPGLTPRQTHSRAGTGAARMVSMSYGTLPSKEAFDEHFRAAVGDNDYTMELVGEDARVVQELSGDPQFAGDFGKAGYRFDDDELYNLVGEMIEAWQSGDEAAGDLASGILYTLDFEWI